MVENGFLIISEMLTRGQYELAISFKSIMAPHVLYPGRNTRLSKIFTDKLNSDPNVFSLY